MNHLHNFYVGDLFMFINLNIQKIIPCVLLLIALLVLPIHSMFTSISAVENDTSYIKWVEFNVPASVMRAAMEADIQSQKKDEKVDYLEILAYLGAKNGGNFKNYKKSQLNDAIEAVKNGTHKENKYYSYYLEAYTAVLAEFVGEYEQTVKDDNGNEKKVMKYGLKVKHPVKGYYGDSDDFGNERSYGFKRKHLGHDFMTSVGTPVAAMEDGIVETLGWNRYGGWRIGIRSFDGKRYYYYAHLKKGSPYAEGLEEGQTVKAGQTIGYVGQTGYSFKEDTNNIQTPHLHFGIQLIFNEVQKDGNNQIWIDCYQISQLIKNPPSSITLE